MLSEKKTEKTESWATDIFPKAESSSLVFDALACLGTNLVGDMDVLLKGIRGTEIDEVCLIQVSVAWIRSVSSI